MMKIGAFLRLKEGEDFSLAFQKLKMDGFDCCHLVYKPVQYTDGAAKQILSAAKESGVEISALFAGFRDTHTGWNLLSDYLDAGIGSAAYGAERRAYLRQAAEFAAKIGVSDVLIHAGFIANNPYSEEYRYMLSLVREFAAFLKERHMNLLLETGGESPVTLLRLIKETATDNVYANVDTGNMIMYGYGNPVDALVTLQGLIRSFHIKDGTPPTDPYALGKEVYFGEGSVDFDQIFEWMGQTRFAGPLIIELEIYNDQREQKLLETLATVREKLNKKPTR